MKILIADDDLTLRNLLTGLLPKWGYQVMAVADGLAAAAVLAQSDAPQLAILDWMMPGQDGIQLCRTLRSSQRSNPLYLVLLTARNQTSDIVQALDAGADDCISKPFDPDELRARIHVGRRVLGLQSELRDQERLQGIVQMAGAVCHEMNQPLQVILGVAELLLAQQNPSSLPDPLLERLREATKRLGQVTHQVRTITHGRTKPYLGSARSIIDLDA